MSWILFVTYASAAVFAAAVFWRVVRYATLPIHLRWELYPVAHERGRAHYGGSYLEDLEWWTKPRESSLIGELKVMIREILLLAGVREHNRKHWYRSFPFHFGLYLLGGLVVLLIAGGFASAAGVNVSPEGGVAGAALYHLTYVLGWAGLALGLVGSVALLARRSLEEDYREYTKTIDYLNLLFFTVTFGVGLVAHAVSDPYFVALRSYFRQLVTLAPSSGIAPLLVLEIVLGSLLLAYIPLTHMSHFFTKWFMYHDIRWADEPNLPGGRLEKKINRVLRYPVSWAAPHIRGDGKKNWVDVATSPVKEDRRR